MSIHVSPHSAMSVLFDNTLAKYLFRALDTISMIFYVSIVGEENVIIFFFSNIMLLLVIDSIPNDILYSGESPT